MPNKPSAKKALKQAIKKGARNLQVKKRVEFLRRKLQQALKNKKLEEAEKMYSQLQQTLDKAAKKYVFAKNKTNRLKSRLVKQLHQLKKK